MFIFKQKYFDAYFKKQSIKFFMRNINLHFRHVFTTLEEYSADPPAGSLSPSLCNKTISNENNQSSRDQSGSTSSIAMGAGCSPFISLASPSVGSTRSVNSTSDKGYVEKSLSNKTTFFTIPTEANIQSSSYNATCKALVLRQPHAHVIIHTIMQN